MGWKPLGRKTIGQTVRSPSPVAAAIVAGIFGVSGALLGALLSTKAANDHAMNLFELQRQKDRSEADAVTVRRLSALAWKVQNYAGRVSSEYAFSGKATNQESPLPHEELLDEAMLFSRDLSDVALSVHTGAAEVLTQGSRCAVERSKHIIATSTATQPNEQKAILDECRKTRLAKYLKLLETIQEFRTKLFTQPRESRRGSLTQPL